MSLIEFGFLYTFIGIICGVCFEYLMYVTELNKDLSIFERITWVALWPLYVLAFLIGIIK
jgi:hypothetical protein